MHYEPGVCTDNWGINELVESADVYSRDFAELSATIRVLSLGLEPATPLLDRLKFLCIVSSLLDEHFVQRLGAIERTDVHDFRSSRLSLRRQIRPRTPHEDKFDIAIRAVVRDQHACLIGEVLPALAGYGVRVVSWDEMRVVEKAKAQGYFERCVKHTLTPLVVDPTHPFPSITSHAVYLCVLLRPKAPERDEGGAKTGGERDPWKLAKCGSSGSGGGAAVPVRRLFLRMPLEGRLVQVDEAGLRFLLVEDLVRAFMGEVARGMQVLSCYKFRVTRNVRMTLEDADFTDRMDLLETVQGEIHRRRHAPPTRLEIPRDFPPDLRGLLVSELGLDEADVFEITSELLDLTGIMGLSFVPLPELRAVEKEPQVPPRFRGVGDRLADDPGAIFRVIRERDVMIEHPRDSFEASTLLFLAAAARDPRVRSIKQVIYRAGSKSPLIEALVRAAKNGKEVTVLVELKASFDEVQNCEYANALEKAGCNIMYGLLGLKIHSKILLVVRKEEDGTIETYCNISTGNFNAKTSKLYTDVSIMTCQEDICSDVHDVFNSLTGYSLSTQFRSILVAPVNMMNRFSEMVQEEAANARAGRPSRIIAQVNGLSDVHIIRELYEAGQAGVKIDLFVRGACRLRPGLPGLSENIRVFSWLGPVLQHRRIFYYYADGVEKYFIGSADWRTRNLNDRTEVAMPVYDERLKKRLGKLLSLLIDKRYLWQLHADGRYYKISVLQEPLEFSVQPSAALTALKLMEVSEEAPSVLSPVANASLGYCVEDVNYSDSKEGGKNAVAFSPGTILEDGASAGLPLKFPASEAASLDGSQPRFLSSSPYVGFEDPTDAQSVVSVALPTSVAGHMTSNGGAKEYPSAGGTAASTGSAPPISESRSRGELVPKGPQGPQTRTKPKKFKINIKGLLQQVDKIAAGAVPVRYSDPADISTLEVMVVQRVDTDDPWSVPKGGISEGETPLDAAIRIAREKGGVSRSEHIATLGWVMRPKRSKTVAVSTYVLQVLDVGNFVNSNHDRTRKWLSFEEAINYAIGSGNTFTTDSLRLAYKSCTEMMKKNAEDLENELTDRVESDTEPLDAEDNSRLKERAEVAAATAAAEAVAAAMEAAETLELANEAAAKAAAASSSGNLAVFNVEVRSSDLVAGEVAKDGDAEPSTQVDEVGSLFGSRTSKCASNSEE